MREYNIRLRPFELESPLSLSGRQTENEHGVYEISGIIPPDKYSEYMTLGMRDGDAEIVAVGEDQSEMVIFRGIVTEFRIDARNDVYILRAELTSGTLALDLAPHTRTFQSDGITYSSILSTITGQHEGADVIMSVGDGETIKGTVVQYHETDWAFAKRLAGHFNTVLIPNSRLQGSKFYFGLPTRPAKHILSESDYGVRHIKGTLDPQGAADGPARDAFCYIVKERDIYYLGDAVALNGQELYVSSIESEFNGSELYHTYQLKRREDFHSPKIYNRAIIGASLDGKVLSVQNDIVTLTIGEDENAANAGTRWYVYSTVYSSPDGTGWYAMPEPGDAVRLYFPTADEAQAYVISSTHTPSGWRSNPDNKSFKNKQGKEALFMPDKLIVTNNNGMSVTIDDNEGISIISNKDIRIEATKSLQVVSGEDVNVLAADEIAMEQGATTFNLADVVGMQGSQVRLD
jgi:hypothetical protein